MHQQTAIVYFEHCTKHKCVTFWQTEVHKKHCLRDTFNMVVNRQQMLQYRRHFDVWRYQMHLLRIARTIERRRQHKLFCAWFIAMVWCSKLRHAQIQYARNVAHSCLIGWHRMTQLQLQRKRKIQRLQHRYPCSVKQQTLTFWAQFTRKQHSMQDRQQRVQQRCRLHIKRKFYLRWLEGYRFVMDTKMRKRIFIRHWRQCSSLQRTHKYITAVHRQKCAQHVRRKWIQHWREYATMQIALRRRTQGLIVKRAMQRKMMAMRFWNKFYRRQKRCFLIRIRITEQHEMRVTSTIFYMWWHKFQHRQKFRALQQYVMQFNKNRALTQMFNAWHNIVPLLKRERMQLNAPQLVFEFLRWRQHTKQLVLLRTHYTALQVWRKRKYFVMYKKIFICAQTARSIEDKRASVLKRLAWMQWKIFLRKILDHRQRTEHGIKYIYFVMWRAQFKINRMRCPTYTSKIKRD